MVALCVLVSRYKHGVQNVEEQVQGESERKVRTRKWLESLDENLRTSEDRSRVVKETYQMMTNGQRNPDANEKGPYYKFKPTWEFCIKLSLCSLVLGIIGLAFTLSFAFRYLSHPEWWAIFLVCLFAGTIVVSLVALQLQPQNSDRFSFMAPGVPYIPALAIFIYVLLIANLHWMTFARFGIWMAIGEYCCHTLELKFFADSVETGVSFPPCTYSGRAQFGTTPLI